MLFNVRHLQKVLAEYVGYFNDWRPHRSLGQRAPCAPRAGASHRSAQAREVIVISVLGGVHHVYQRAHDDVPDLILAPFSHDEYEKWRVSPSLTSRRGRDGPWLADSTARTPT